MLSGAMFNRPVFFVLAVLFGCSVIVGNGWVRLRTIQAASAMTSNNHPLPAYDKSSATGYEDGLRTLILMKGTDSCHWIMNAQRMAHEGHWRIRNMPDDNYPAGREMHWSQFLLWWLVLLGTIQSTLTGIPLGAAIESAAPWSVALIHLVLLIALPWAVHRRIGWFAAGILSLGLGTVYGYSSLFFVGSPDHHGLVATALMASLLFLAVGGGGWIANGDGGQYPTWFPVRSQAQRWFVASGICAGVGLWISAATAASVFLGVGLGVGVATVFVLGRNSGAAERHESSLWRLWGVSAALTSLAFYLIEYFPNHLGFRLEVNHPFYALAMLGAGEILFRITRWRTEGIPLVGRGIEPWTLLAALAAVALVPATIFFFKDSVFIVGDKFLWALHRDYIHEFKSLPKWIRLQSVEALIVCLSPLVLLTIPVFVLSISHKISRAWKTILMIPTVAALWLGLLGVYQLRWMTIAESLWLAVLSVLAASTVYSDPKTFSKWWERGLAAVFLLVLFVQMPQRVAQDVVAAFRGPPTFTPDEAVVLFARDIAYRLRALGGDDVPVVASAPTTTTWMMYFGGLRGLGTLYWENTSGLKSAAELYAARDDETAEAIINRHSISFIAILSYEPFVSEYPRLLRGLPLESEPTDTLAYRLANGVDIPLWAQDVPVPVPERLGSAWAAIYDVQSALVEPPPASPR